MTLEQFIAKYAGQRVGDGQCGTLVRAYWNEVDHTVPPSYINSKDYWSNPVPGYIKTQTSIPGAIAIYDGHGTFTEGHSAIYVNNGIVFEQNADPDGSPAHEYPRANTYLLGYLVKEDSVADNSKPTSTQVGEEFQALAGRQPRQDEVDLFIGLNWFDGQKQYLYPGVQVYRDTITNLEHDRDTHLYPYIEAVTQALGLPDSATADDCVKAINALKQSGVSSVIVNGQPYAPVKG